ncbi:MAG: DUF971 family protein [Planctomycetota bacterium]|jgi:DUF971 family protein
MKPTDIKLHQVSRILELSFEDGSVFKLPTEFLRVHSPSAEVQGHGPGQEVLQVGKEDVNIVSIEPMGHYAVKLVFDDNHNSGLYSWSLLHDLGLNYEEKWQAYLARLEAAGHQRKERPVI